MLFKLWRGLVGVHARPDLHTAWARVNECARVKQAREGGQRSSIISAMFDQLPAFVQVLVTTLEARLRLIYIVFDQSTKCCLTCLFSCDIRKEIILKRICRKDSKRLLILLILC